jgi:TetR/AcrR family transcriptional regulator, repressor for neighboring sulfatase
VKRDAKRVRRSPDEARTLILDAAERVYADHLPDAVGLKEIGREAGVSHALVTHYFGTYAGLVEAALERRFNRLRESLVTQLFFLLDGTSSPTAEKPTARELLAVYRSAIARHAADPITVRLAVWAMMSGRSAQEDFFAHRVQGLRLLTDALELRTNVPRDDLEFCLVASFAMTVVWTVGGGTLSRALGKKKTAGGFDPSFEERVARMIDGYLQQSRDAKGTLRGG